LSYAAGCCPDERLSLSTSSQDDTLEFEPPSHEEYPRPDSSNQNRDPWEEVFSPRNLYSGKALKLLILGAFR
jgi:hypothetical protein